MEEMVEHKMVSVNGINIHIAEKDAPPSAEYYTSLHIVDDILALIDHLGHDQVSVVGHDWGGIIAWCLSLFQPDRVKVLVALRAQEMEAEFARVGTKTVLKEFLTYRDPVPLMIPRKRYRLLH
ncbi:hypothetical protein GIB67_031551 [Kingdonia uniflora]|uniref:AB hydrolase-1 domain-containing protein n=1 Tax=Kingdonia uniflora TaxID=39325 RepID=A0A7J7PBN4_9MAGN|nr:hypothetical protein GIB67_031551 [Kingdonia uniflora]